MRAGMEQQGKGCRDGGIEGRREGQSDGVREGRFE